MRQLRSQLMGIPMQLGEAPGFETRLAELRVMYEPYSQALAYHLLLELPPWVHAQPRRDNWQGGPWDKLLHAQHTHAQRPDEHF